MKKKARIFACVISLLLITGGILSCHAFADEKSWIYPEIAAGLTHDDNVFLTNNAEKWDLITTVRPGVRIEPPLIDHRAFIRYVVEMNIFSKYHNQNNYNHDVITDFRFNFNKLHFDIDNRFRLFSDRSGAEDVRRVPRTQDESRFFVTYDFAQMDVSIGGVYLLNYYRTREDIGSFQGKDLTYQDLNRNEYRGEVEFAIKLGKKTALLFSGDLGGISHMTGQKPDSLYFDALTGLRGKLTKRLAIEGKVGYRGQKYMNYGHNFHSFVFDGSVIANFTKRDILRIDFNRTTNDSIYKNNAYYESTFVGGSFRHGFTKRIYAEVRGNYQRDDYPTRTVEDGKSANRLDHIWGGQANLSYETPKGIVAAFNYLYKRRISKFSTFDYVDNRLITSLGFKF